MKKTLYVSDLDGTLLDRNSQLSEESISTLNRLINECGVNFTIATARTPATVVGIMERIHSRLPFIVMNGAATWDNIGRRFISTSPFDNSTLEQVCNIFEAHGLNPMVYRRNGNSIEVHHCGQFSPQEQEFVEERKRLSKKFHLNDTAYKINDNEALLIFAMNDYSRLKPIYNDVIKHVNCSSVCYHDIFDPSAGLMETYAPGVSKAVAIRRLADEIGAERLIVFGDNRNDIPMMKIADYAVAPENAIDEVKAIAHEVSGLIILIL
jgi:Cof subfamily protein (haloacid dehalogenase superfamily)